MHPASSRTRRLSCFALSLSLALGTLGPAAAQSTPPAPPSLPALGDTVSADFSPAAERQLGERIMQVIRRDPAYLDDLVLQDYLLSLWRPLLSAARSRGDLSAELSDRFAWDAFLVRDRSVNAFALPGGYVGVHLGLIGMTSTGDELASVLAHELAHVTQRHIARSLNQQRQQSMLAIASMILGVMAASRSPDAASALITGGQAAALQGQLNFSRDMEREADRIGLGLLEGAGFSVLGMPSMFERLQQVSRLNDSNAFPYLRSHPLTSERIGEARARTGLNGGRAAPSPTLEHALMQGRARVLMDTRPDAARSWLSGEDGGRSPGRATALLQASTEAHAAASLRDWPRMQQALARAQPLVQGDARATRALAFIAADLALAEGDAGRAQVALAAYRREGSRLSELLGAQVDLAQPGGDTGTWRRAAEELQTWATLHPRDHRAWEGLGQAWERLGQPLRAVRAQAEARYLLGDLQGAIDRLRAAQRLGNPQAGSADFIEASVIDVRLREIEAEWLQRRREEMGR
jgi:beta-barrel assembly-enhancing protease